MRVRRCSPLLGVALLLGAACTNSPSPPPEGADRAQAAPAAPPTQEDAQTKRRRIMVDRQIADRGVKDRRVLDAMRKIPRHLFVPDIRVSEAYLDRPVPIGHGQTISQPYIVAFMTEMLDLKPSDRVLEIGTGSGYQAAVLAELVERVYTIEIVEPLGLQAKDRLERLGYDNVEVRIGDGYQGWTEHAPFDKIIVTCAPEDVPRPLVEQLAPGGRMAIPVGPTGGAQDLVLLTKDNEGSLKQDRVLPVRFVPLTRSTEE